MHLDTINLKKLVLPFLILAWPQFNVVAAAPAAPAATAVAAKASAAAPAKSADELSADLIVRNADKVRNPQQPFSCQCSLTEFKAGKQNEQMDFRIFSKKESPETPYRSLVRFIEPAKDRGKLMLMDRDIIWFFDPGSKSTIRLSPQQRLIGQASNGDVLTVDFSGDYKAKLEKKETISDPANAKRNCYKLELTSKTSSSNYSKIDYWVEEKTFMPVKGKFYSESGQLMKIIYYQGVEKVLGVDRPTELLIIDGVNKNFVTKMNLRDYKNEKIPNEWFQKDYLPHLKE